ncbi:MAG TPA: aspartate kinase [Bacteroidales bacterium]|nr:aspartate kinase [Bacteroidales bacterium]
MLVFKFGGASVSNADAVKNLAKILAKYDDNIIVVVSAMGKTTNALEQLTDLYVSRKQDELEKSFENIRAYHYYIMQGLFPDDSHPVYEQVKKIFKNMQERFEGSPTMNYDFDYDQIVSNGEMLSTTIVAAYLNEAGIAAGWKDIRESLISDDTYREGRIDWNLSPVLVKNNFVFNKVKVLVTQGFLAATVNNITTTLGREGSDYTAAILAYLLDIPKVVIWKDVPGVLNADPKWFDNTILLPKLSYFDAIELAYYGASVIHPKTIQPLKKKNISLYVKSFVHPDEPGSVIGNDSYDKLVPSFIFKMNQVLIKIFPRDFSFIAEDNLETIIGIFARTHLKINLMQNSAVSFMVCVNNDRMKIPQVIKALEDHFTTETENGLELVTIRYYDEKTIKRVTVAKEILLEQHNLTTAQMVMRDKPQSS